MSVRILEDHVINQIAAGEVVERPASVVKELVENALDAGGRALRVSLRGGGRSAIRISDDGVGMDRADALMAIERHATSKIRQAEDLEAVQTLGFRGEALPSIAAVSRFQLLTRQTDALVGTRVRIEGGTLLDVEDAGCAAGTEIEVRSLFYNLPARRKFLRTQATELSHCVEAVIREALVRPDVDFTVYHEDRELLRAPVTDDWAGRARDLLESWGQRLQPVQFASRGYEVRGLVSPVGVHKSTPAGAQYLYVNGRFVRDPVLRRAVNEAYRELVPKGRYPVVVLDVRMPPGRVDVNVHPSKIEVRFHEPRDLVHLVASGLREGLEQHGIHRPEVRTVRPAHRLVEDPRAPSLPLHGPSGPLWLTPPSPAAPPETPRPSGSSKPLSRGIPAHPDEDLRFERREPARPSVDALIAELDPVGPIEAPPLEVPASLVAEPPPAPFPPQRSSQERPPTIPPPPSPAGRLLPVPRFRDLRVIGQLRSSYILCEGAGDLVIIDQHAAHERVRLHALLSDRDAQLGQPQRLLTPVLVSLPRGRAQLLAERLDLLEALRIEAELFGPGEIAIKAIPPLLRGADLPQLVTDLADGLAAEGDAASGEDLVRHLLATMACHSAVRAHEPLSDYAMRSLLASLDEVDFEVCAHGRPVVIRIDLAELEARFHRT